MQKTTMSGPKRFLRRIQLRSYVFFHKSRKTPYFLYDSHIPSTESKGLKARIISFFAALSLLTVLAFIIPLRPTYSDHELRELAEFPEFSGEALMDGSYFTGLNTWFADTFPLRDTFLTMQNQVEQLYGVQTQTITGSVTQGDAIPTAPSNPSGDDTKPEESAQQSFPAFPPAAEDTLPFEDDFQPEKPVLPPEAAPSDEPAAEEPEQTETEMPAEEQEEELVIPELDEDAVVEQLSAVLTIDNAAFEYYNFVLESADRYTSAVNRAAKQLDGISNVYNLITPNSMGICVPENIQQQANTSDQKAAIEYMYGSLSDKVTAVPVYNTLLKHYLDGEYLFFRTDHHWTALGAYRAYEQFAKAAGFEPTPLEDYTAHEYEGFLGSFYNSTKSEAMKNTPDTVFAYEPPSTNTIHIKTEKMDDWRYLIIGNVEESSAGNKYGTFIGGDNPFSYIENPNLDDGSAVMLIKESYGNAFAPFLVENYQYVYIVDYRYVSEVDDRNLKEMCQDLEIDDVLFLNTISTTRSKGLIGKLEAFVD